MARIRSIKPEFFWSKDLAKTSHAARLLAIALWGMVDGEGRMLRISPQIHTHAFPWEPELDIEALLQELVDQGMIRQYEHGQKEYIEVCQFRKHQRLQGKEATMKSKLPAFSEDTEIRVESTIKEDTLPETTQAKKKEKPGKPNKTLAHKNETKKSHSSSVINDSVQEIFDYWRVTLEHPRAALDDKRIKLIKGKLKHYTKDDLISAINGCSKTSHNMGDNDRNQRYDSLELILRDAAHIDTFIKNSKNNAYQAPMTADDFINGHSADSSVVATYSQQGQQTDQQPSVF